MPQKYGSHAMGAVKDVKPCLVCDNPKPVYSWTDAHGEGYCTDCGTPYQLKNGKLEEGESYPRCNVADRAIPILREFWAETHSPNGTGQFMVWQDYPDQLAGRRKLAVWMDSHHLELQNESA